MQNKTTRITDSLILQNGNNQDIDEITELNLRSYKIIKIENLNHLSKLQTLNLSHNSISKIENLSKLFNLIELNLSDNYIKAITGLDALTQLEILNLNGNQISEIDIANPSLKILKISRNQIKDPLQLLNLKVLENLHTLSISDNPFCRTFTYTEYLYFLNQNLQVIDNKALKADQIEISKKLFGNHPPSDQEQLKQNIRVLEEKKIDLEKEIIQIESKIQKAQNLLKTYKDCSDSEEEEEQLIAERTLAVLKNQLAETIQNKRETEELIQQLTALHQQFKVKPQLSHPNEQLNRINSLYIRLQAVLQQDLGEQQRQLFESALGGNINQLLESFYETLEITLEKIPLLPQEQAIQEASEQVHQQISELYEKVTLQKDVISITDKDCLIQKSIVLLKKLFKRAEKKYKKIEEFNSIKNKFLYDFEIETQQLADKWKEYDNKMEQLKTEKASISRELEEQFNQLLEQKEELKKQYRDMDFYMEKSNKDFQEFRQKQDVAKQMIIQELQQLEEDKEEFSQQVEQLREQAEKFGDLNAEKEEQIRLLNEELDVLQSRISGQYGISYQMNEEQQQAIANIDFLTNQKDQLQREIEELQQEQDLKLKQQQDISQRYQQQYNRLKSLMEETEKNHNKLMQTEQLCDEAEKILKQLNSAIQDKELDVQKYERIIQEGTQEREKNKYLKQENQQLVNQNRKAQQEYDNEQQQYNQLQDQLNQAKNNLQQVTQLTIDKEAELLNLEKQLITLEKQVQDNLKQKEMSSNEYDSTLKEIKKLNIEKAKLTQQVDDATIDLQALKQEYQLQQQNLQSLNKQIDLKVTELSTATHYHKNEVGQTQDQISLMHSQLIKLQESCDNKGYEFKQLVDQIENLISKRDGLVKEVCSLQQQVINYDHQQSNKPYMANDDDSILQKSYDRVKSDWLKPPKHQLKSQSMVGDYPRTIKPRSANHSMLYLRKSPNKDQSVQSVIQNLEELNSNLDRMYMESLEKQGNN